MLDRRLKCTNFLRRGTLPSRGRGTRPTRSPPVERCLACEAVVNKVKGAAGLPFVGALEYERCASSPAKARRRTHVVTQSAERVWVSPVSRLAYHGLATCRAVGFAKAEARQRSTGVTSHFPLIKSRTLADPKTGLIFKSDMTGIW
jgi:hypothetical protein